jgi:hypothetical protein
MKFIRNFSGISAPMMDTVKKRHKSFHWTKEGEKSFNLLKKKITEQPIMVLPDFNKTFQVRCDVSGFAIGVVLSQDDRSIAYFSEKMNEVKIKYSTYDKVILRSHTSTEEMETLFGSQGVCFIQ